MHMLMVVVGGIALLGVVSLFGRLWGGDIAGVAIAAKLFIPVWLAVSITNLVIGVSRAGYSIRDELPILLVVFAVPTVIALVVVWQISRP